MQATQANPQKQKQVSIEKNEQKTYVNNAQETNPERLLSLRDTKNQRSANENIKIAFSSFRMAKMPNVAEIWRWRKFRLHSGEGGCSRLGTQSGST